MALLAVADDILGINARNLDYIARYNPHEGKQFADDKIYTKHYLQARGISVAKLYATIRTLRELREFDPASLPKRFVIKPNRGYGGEGIIVIDSVTGDRYRSADGDVVRWADLFKHCVSILDGWYAISGLRDSVVIEERLDPHPYFAPFVSVGLPDIRVIVFKFVPVIAMLRLPTALSHGKANLHLGAIGVGLDIGTGRATYGVQRGRFITKLPNGDPLSVIQIPQWDDILLTAARTQHSTRVGYLAADVTLTRTGLKVLELNARAGLEIQVCNRRYLRRDLRKLADLKVTSPADGVRVAKTLFSRTAVPSQGARQIQKPVIGPVVTVRLANANNRVIQAKIDLHSETNELRTGIPIADAEKTLRIRIEGRTLSVPFQYRDFAESGYDLILSGKYLTDFYIDVTRPHVPTVVHQSTDEKILENVDRKLAVVSDQLHLLAYLKPTNLRAARTAFHAHPAVAPIFQYRQRDDRLRSLLAELHRIPQYVGHPLMPLFQAKIDETEKKIHLLEDVGTPAFVDHARQLYGSVTDDDVQAARTYLGSQPLLPDTSSVLTSKQVIQRLEQALRTAKLGTWKVRVLENAAADMQVNKRHTIFLKADARITEHRLTALVAHEIETHIYRLENGLRQPFRIFAQGTADYLATEEGIAIYNQKRLGIPLGVKNQLPALNTIAVSLAQHGGFPDVYRELVTTYHLTPAMAWTLTARVKRGLSDTTMPGAFPKDRLYFSGYRAVEHALRLHGIDVLATLYVGKVGIDDLPLLATLTLQPPRYLPTAHP